MLTEFFNDYIVPGEDVVYRERFVPGDYVRIRFKAEENLEVFVVRTSYGEKPMEKGE